jgi:hypothetical protein
MPFQMAFNKEELSGAPPMPASWYTLQLKDFKPKAAKPKPPSTVSESVSLNAELVVIEPTEYENRRVFCGLNTKMAFMWPDFVHALGMEMEVVQDENAGTEKESKTLPGVFQGMDTDPEDPSKWKYLGPLLNKTMEVELAEIPSKDGFKAKNEIRQFKCAVPGCTEKHSTNLIKQS